MSASPWVKVPIGPHGRRWSTLHPLRTVLVVVHTLTAWNRLADVLPIFDSDHRVQLVFTFPSASAIDSGVEPLLRRSGAVHIDWAQATNTEFDLAISAHNSGDLHEISAPLIILSHGIGYTKYSESRNRGIAESRNRGIAESRNRGIAESRNRGIAESRNRSVYGLSPEWLIRYGSVVPSAIVLSHDEQYERLAAETPQALSAAVVAGDPCFDRMRASATERERYRSALGADRNSTVVAISSTWGDKSLLGRRPDLVNELLAELPDDHVVAAVVHPNTWYAHGPWQLRFWLGKSLRAGLRLIPPAEGWQQTIIAADVTVGDHGAVTGYSAAIGNPTLLATFPDADVAAGSAIAALSSAAPRLDMHRSLVRQLHETIQRHHPDQFSEVQKLTSSVPDESAQLLRRLCYNLMDLEELAGSALVPPYLAETLVPERESVQAWWVAGEWDGTDARLTRWPADVSLRRGLRPIQADRHLVVANTHPQRDLRNAASIVLHQFDTADEIGQTLVETLRSRPACRIAVAIVGADCRMQHRDGRQLTASTSPNTVDSAAAASAIYAWLSEGRSWSDIPEDFDITVGKRPAHVVVTAVSQ
ncbi:hypothetical protein [Saccharopolyspora sp. 5N708]|uniref:hypothetical protein n=1 Tax=Saccharopolyspora sp. 5N708 TaxID=3457424 RepID=UPI003FD21FFF